MATTVPGATDTQSLRHAHRNFASKDELILAVLDHRAQLWTRQWQILMTGAILAAEQGRSPRRRARL